MSTWDRSRCAGTWGSGFTPCPVNPPEAPPVSMARTPSLSLRRGVCPLCRRPDARGLPTSAPFHGLSAHVVMPLSRSLHVVHLSGFFPHSRLVSAAVCIFMCLSESVCQIPHRFLLAFGWDFTDFVDESGVNLISLQYGHIPPFTSFSVSLGIFCSCLHIFC